MNIYLAARYSRREEMLRVRDDLHTVGHVVTSRWIEGSHQLDAHGIPIGDHGEALVETGDGRDAAELRLRFCQDDMTDVLAAECVISFTEEPRTPTTNRGGRHVELGIALGLLESGHRIRLITVGYRENIFHWLPSIEFFVSWSEALIALSHEAVEEVGAMGGAK